MRRCQQCAKCRDKGTPARPERVLAIPPPRGVAAPERARASFDRASRRSGPAESGRFGGAGQPAAAGIQIIPHDEMYLGHVPLPDRSGYGRRCWRASSLLLRPLPAEDPFLSNSQCRSCAGPTALHWGTPRAPRGLVAPVGLTVRQHTRSDIVKPEVGIFSRRVRGAPARLQRGTEDVSGKKAFGRKKASTPERHQAPRQARPGSQRGFQRAFHSTTRRGFQRWLQKDFCSRLWWALPSRPQHDSVQGGRGAP